MPLLSPLLVEAILRMTDKDRSDFVGFPATYAEAGVNWARAARSYFEAAAFPPLPPPIHDLAESAMSSQIASTLTASLGLAGAVAIPAGFAVYAAAMAAGSLGLAVAPAGLFVMPALPPVNDPVTPATAIAGAVDAWVKTGTSIPPGTLWA